MSLRHFAATWGFGGTTAQTVVEPLKSWERDGHDEWALWVRETVQNAWDAKREDAVSVDVELGWAVLEGPAIDALEKALEAPPVEAAIDIVGSCRANPAIAWVRDGGTVGLNGPVAQGGDLPNDERLTRWINVVAHNGRSGAPAGRDQGGGTKGIGKNVNFLRSAANAVLIYSRADDGTGVLVSRLMVLAHGEPYRRAGFQYAGLHWWCGAIGDGGPVGDVPLPLVDASADALIASLGLAPFEGADTGTMFVVLAARAPGIAPDGTPYDDESPAGDQGDAWRDVMIEAIRWNLWPKVLPVGQREAEVRLRIVTPGRETSVDALRSLVGAGETVPYLMNALIAAMGPEDVDHAPAVVLATPGGGTAKVGRVGLVRAPAIAAVATGEIGTAKRVTAGVTGEQGGLIALMRNPKLIVRYLEVEVPDGVLLRGAFIVADEAMNKLYADYEPATHDSWASFQGTRKPGRHVARHPAKTEPKIREMVGQLFGTRQPSSVPSAGKCEVTLGTIMDLWAAAGGVAGPTDPPPRDPPGPPGNRRPFRELEDTVLDQLERDGALHEYGIRFEHQAHGDFEASVSLELMGGGEGRDSGYSAQAPVLLGWRSSAGLDIAGPRLALAEDADRDWVVRFRVPIGSRARLRIGRAG